ncbi:fimbrial biogenesis outer membrane usher protein [Rheinheimera riviphila]|uniref:Fimbrial biogenesis outer membrane usher protein n=1 Tax=Rheinheimera riviphila TaxID=1834037 RepID=A0A437QGF4_9GAMM|nr:fimbria/pilus outer membrane usher protein [Rheinheimera riviphila]RVU33420.1 fimbrial biogenesis outer membrane usher protein [Rheinheimera riviphila]
MIRRFLVAGFWLMFNSAVNAEDTAPLLYLNVVINDWHTGQTLLVKPQAGGFMLETAPLRTLLPALNLPASDWTDSRQLPLQQIEYQVSTQQLHLRLAESWLPQTRLQQRPPAPTPELTYGEALILNYDLVAEYQTPRQQMLGANLDLNLNYQQSHFRHQQVVLRQQQQTELVRLDTSLSIQDHQQLRSLQLGDFITPASSGGRAYRLAGVQWRRNYSLQPDLITYPLPELNHSLAVPSNTDLFIQGMKTFSADLPPGPFVIASQPMLNGAGVATFVSTDVFGRTQQVEQPFYVADSLLAKGLTDYALSLGWPRLSYGQMQSHYASKPALVAAYRYGQQADRTLGFTFEHFEQLKGFSLEIQQQLGLAGVLGAAVSQSFTGQSFTDQGFADENGAQWRLNYSYLAPGWQVNASHLQRDSNFFDLASYYGAQLLAKRQSQIGLSFHSQFGSAALYLLEQQYAQQPKKRYLNLSYSLAGDRHWSGFLTLNYQTEQRAWNLALSVSYQFDQQLRGSVYASQGDNDFQYLSLHQSRSEVHGWSFAAQQSLTTAANNSQLYGNYRNHVSDSYLSFSNQAGNNRWSGGSRGSLVATAGEWFITEPVSQAFAVVDTQGHAGIDIYNSYRYVATTNERGKALVPHLLANLPNQISIDPLQLPLDSQISNFQQQVTPAGVTGIHLQFDINQQRTLLLKIYMPGGAYAPLGSQLFAGGQHISSVGWDGEVMLAATYANSTLKLTLPDGQHCALQLPAPPVERGFVPVQCIAK